MKRALLITLTLSISMIWCICIAQLKAPEAGKKAEVSNSHPAAGLKPLNQQEQVVDYAPSMPVPIKETHNVKYTNSASAYSGTQPESYYTYSPLKPGVRTAGSIYGISATGRFNEYTQLRPSSGIASQSYAPEIMYGIAPVINRYRTNSAETVEFPLFTPSAVVSKAPTGDKASAPLLPGDPGASTGAAVPLDGGFLLALLAGGGIGLNLLRRKKKDLTAT